MRRLIDDLNQASAESLRELLSIIYDHEDFMSGICSVAVYHVFQEDVMIDLKKSVLLALKQREISMRLCNGSDAH